MYEQIATLLLYIIKKFHKICSHINSPSEQIITINHYNIIIIATRLYRPLLPASLKGYILYRHRVVVYRFLMVFLPVLVHGKGSRGIYRLWVRPYFSSSVPQV